MCHMLENNSPELRQLENSPHFFLVYNTRKEYVYNILKLTKCCMMSNKLSKYSTEVVGCLDQEEKVMLTKDTILPIILSKRWKLLN